MPASPSKDEAASKAKPASTRTKTTKTGRTRTVTSEKPAPAQREKRAKTAVGKATARETSRSRQSRSSEKGLIDLLEHGLRDMYYAERKIYRALPKMIKAADDDELAAALTSHREETAGHIEALEQCFENMGLRVKGEKCDAIDGILEEAEGILEDFGGTLAGDAAIIFSARAVEHYEICRYSAMVGFADALGLDEVQSKLQTVLDQETAADQSMTQLAEGSINEAASEYDEDDPAEDPAPATGKAGTAKDNAKNDANR